MRWKRTEEEWEAIIEALEDKLERERERRLDAEDKADKRAAELQALRGATGCQSAGTPKETSARESAR